MESKSEPELDAESLKRKSKSPSSLIENDNKRPKIETEEQERPEDIAKQYKKFVAAPKFNLNSEELFCICRKPDVEGELMISCDGCEEWFHAKCMKIDPKLTPILDKFFCKFCQWKGDGVTKWNRKCRLPGCAKPIRKAEKSKYCSDECGEKYILSKLSQSDAMTSGEISFVVNYCRTYADMKSMGCKFPELPEVLSLDLKGIPKEVQKILMENDLKQAEVRAEYTQSEIKSKYLERVKEMIGVINEDISALAGPMGEEEANNTNKKKKKGKSKKIDICCFWNGLNKTISSNVTNTVDTDVREMFKSEIQKASALYQNEEQAQPGDICLQDRRKCIRHNGWFNLLSDRIWKRSSELKEELETLERLKTEALRSYSISVYEGEPMC